MIWFFIAVGLVARSANRRKQQQILNYLMQSREVESNPAQASTLTAIIAQQKKQNEEENPSATRRKQTNRCSQQLV